MLAPVTGHWPTVMEATLRERSAKKTMRDFMLNLLTEARLHRMWRLVKLVKYRVV